MKYKLTNETETDQGLIMYRIESLVDIPSIGVRKGDLGGWVESESNLSQDGDGWIFSPGIVCRGGTIRGGTIEGGTIEGGTILGGTILGGTIEGGTIRSGTIRGGTIRGGTIWGGTIESQPLTISRSDGYFFTLQEKNGQPAVAAGCRYFTFPEAREHWQRTRGGTPLGDETMRILDILEKGI